MALELQNVGVEHQDEVAWITLNRPEALNAFAGDMREELLQALMDAQSNEDIRVVVITGAGRAFCAGGDVKRMAEIREADGDFEPVRGAMETGRRVVQLLHELDRPVIAMVNGVAAGAGCNLALACDLRIASENARFAQSFVKVGLHPDWGGSYFLPRRIGLSKALEIWWSGRTVEAEEARDIGLLDRLVPHAQLRSSTAELAKQLAGAPRRVVALTKLAAYQSPQFDLDGMLEFELDAQAQCWAAPESKELLRAFAPKKS